MSPIFLLMDYAAPFVECIVERIYPFLGILLVCLIITLIALLGSLIYTFIVEVFIIVTTRTVEERVSATVVDKTKVYNSSRTMYTGSGFIYVPSSTEYCITVRYNGFEDDIDSKSLYSSTSIGDSVQVKYIRYINKNNKVVRQYLKR